MGKTKQSPQHEMISTVDQGPSPAISTVHPDIIQTHIFTRLDGPTLASAACASSQLHALSSDDSLWRQICNQTWPSTADPRVRHVISSFPSGHRSFYSDCFPVLHRSPSARPPPPSTGLISAVDLHFKNRPILSRVQNTETKTGWFKSSPFRVDLLDRKETVQTRVKLEADDDACHLSLSWILIDPSQARAGNFSSLEPVSTKRHWLTGELQVSFGTVLRGEKRGEEVQVAAVVTCGGEGDEVQVKELSLVVEDMEGKSLSGEDSLVILQEAMENGERRRRRDGEATQRYDEFVEMRRERREMKQRKERTVDLVCVSTVVTLLLTSSFFLVNIIST